MHRLRRLDPGLDRDQGLSASAPVAGCARAPRAPGSACSSRRRCCGWAWPTSAALAALFVTALWTPNGFTGDIERTWTLDNFRDLFTLDVYRTITLRTLGIAALVTVIDALIAFPVALYMAKVATPRAQRLLVIAVLMPLWASYLVKAYAWRGDVLRRAG